MRILNTVKGKVIQVEREFDQGYVAEVELLAGSNTQMIGIANQIICNDITHELPVYLVETGKKEGTYRLLINTSDYPNEKREQLVENLQVNEFSLAVEEDPDFELHHNCQNMIILVDQSALFDSLADIDFLALKNIEFNVFVKAKEKDPVMEYLQQKHGDHIVSISSFTNEEVQSILDNQLMGTKLFISGSWSMVQDVKQVAYAAGFTDEEIQTREMGEKEEQLYCVKCYKISKKTNSDQQKCEHCNTLLDVSEHYSKTLDSYLGYIHIN